MASIRPVDGQVYEIVPEDGVERAYRARYHAAGDLFELVDSAGNPTGARIRRAHVRRWAEAPPPEANLTEDASPGRLRSPGPPSDLPS